MNKYVILAIGIILFTLAFIGTYQVSAQEETYYYAPVGGVIVSAESPGINLLLIGIVVAATLIVSYALATKLVKKEEPK